MQTTSIGFLGMFIFLTMWKYCYGNSELFSCNFVSGSTCGIRSSQWAAESGRERENNDQGWYYVTDRHTEYGMKSFSLPSLSASSITAHLSFYYKFYGYTTCSLFVYVGKSLRFNQRRSNSKDSAWRRTPNVNFCCCPRCPRIYFQAVCKFGTGGVAVDDIIVSAIKSNQPQSRLTMLTTPMTNAVSPSVHHQAMTPTAVGTTTKHTTTLQARVSTRPSYSTPTYNTLDTTTGTSDMHTSSTSANGCTNGNTSVGLEKSLEIFTTPRQSNKPKTQLESPKPSVASAGELSGFRNRLKIILPVMMIMILVIISGAIKVVFEKRRNGLKVLSSVVNTSRSCDTGSQGLEDKEGRYPNPHQDVKLETSDQDSQDHHYIPMKSIQPKEQSPDAEGIPIVIYESPSDDTEKCQIPMKHEHEYMNSEQRPHFYANCIRSDHEGIAETTGYADYASLDALQDREDIYINPHQDFKLKTSDQESQDHLYTPMNPIQPKKQSPDAEGINPVLINENGANDSEKYQIPRKNEHKYMNS